MYKTVIRPLMFLLDPESAHALVARGINCVHAIPFINKLVKRTLSASVKDEVEIAGLHFKGRVGLAAGFDKNADYFRALSMFGFSFIEIGTVTPLPQPGNPKPRLFRLPADNAMINRMGFNNKGIEYVCSRLRNRSNDVIIGGNIGKNTATPNEKAYLDYAICFEKLYDLVDYFTVNISCPNIKGMDKLQDQDSIRKILKGIMDIREQKPSPKPVFLKISPDTGRGQLDEIISIYFEMKLDGLIATNTTTTRENLATSKETIRKYGNGGLSGKPLKEKVKEMIVYICKQSDNRIPIIASGGIMNENDALEMLNAGAKLVQVYTGFIYEGPFVVKRIDETLKRALSQH